MGIFDNMLNYAQYGSAGGVMSKLEQMQNDVLSRPKPGQLCNPGCPVDQTKCPQCLKMQEEIQTLMPELEGLDYLVTHPEELQRMENSVCSLCGAPYEKGEKACPWCGTVYPGRDISVDEDMPEDVREWDAYYLQKTSAVYDKYAEMKLFQSEIGKQYLMQQIPPLLQGVVGNLASSMTSAMGASTSELFPMTAAEIKEGAKKHQLTYYGYISAIMRDEIQNLRQEKFQAKAEIMNQNMERQRQYMERQDQITKEYCERMRQNTQQRIETQRRIADSAMRAQENASRDRLADSLDSFRNRFG